MKKLGFLTMVLALGLVARSSYAGSINTDDKPSSAHTITISGDISITGYVRSEELNAATQDLAGPGVIAAGGDTDDDLSSGDNGWSPKINIRLDIGLAEKVSAVAEIQTRRYAASSGAIGNLIGDTIQAYQVGQLYVRVDEFLYQQLSFQLGMQDFKLDLRGNGNAFLIDLRHSELAFASPMTENFGPGFPVYANGGVGVPSLAPAVTRVDENDAGGFRMTYNDADTLYLDIFWFQVGESGIGAFAAGGGASTGHLDETLYGVNLDYNLDTRGDRRSLINAIFCVFSNDQNANRAYNIGAGIDYWWESLELFAEIHGQFGDYTRLNGSRVTGLASASTGKQIDQKAWGGYVGGKYEFESEYKPWIDLEFWYLTGDDGQLTDDNEDFVSLENVNDSMIVESSFLGLDVDSNYWSIKVSGGFTTSIDKPQDFDATLFYGFFSTVEDPDRVALGTGTDSGASRSNIDEEIGSEVDVKFTWRYSESLSFTAAAGFLFNGDFFGNRPAATSANGGGYATGDDTMQLYTLTTNVKF